MTNRTLIILSSALVVLVILLLIGQRAETPQRTTAGGRLVPGLEATVNDVHRLEIVGAAGETVATIERDEDGWLVLERDGYPADFTKVRETLVALAEASIVEQTTANPELYHRLGVEDVEDETAGGVAVTLHGAAAEPFTIIVGDAAARGQRYVRPARQAQSYLVDRDPDPPRRTPQWLDPVIVDVPGNRVAQVTITHPDGETLRIVKDSPQQANFTVEGVPEGRELQYPGVANVTGTALRELRLEDVQRSDQDDNGEATVAEYRTFDGLRVTVTALRRGDEAWASFAADVAAERLGNDAAEAGEDGAADTPENGPGEPAGGAPADDSAPQADAAAEAEAINRRTAGWRYRIPTHQYEQMTRRITDYLQAQPEDD